MYLGFTPKTFLLSSFNKERTKIGLSEVTTQLNEVMVQTNKNAKAIVKKALISLWMVLYQKMFFNFI